MSWKHEYSGKNLAIFGLGKAGRGALARLQEAGANLCAWDDNHDVVERTQQWYLGEENLSFMPIQHMPWDRVTALVLSPGVPLTYPKPHDIVTLARQHGCPIICDVELLYRASPEAMYIGITGTNGKSTTTALIGHCLKEAGKKVEVGGNIGTAASALPALEADGIYVLELSSYQLELLDAARFHVAALLNITPDHLDRHGGMEGYIAAKCHIFDHQRPDDFAVIAVDDESTQRIMEEYKDKPGTCVTVSAKDGLLPGLDEEALRHLPGEHNRQNVVVACAVLRAAGLTDDEIVQGIRSFPGLEHRLKTIAKFKHITFINDSKATNADATSRALRSVENIYWIVGGRPKAGGIQSLSPLFDRVAHAFLIGESEDDFAETLEGKLDYTRCGTLEKAVKAAFKKASEDMRPAVVLLSPACASFDQFASFEVRGEAFCYAVKVLLEQKGHKVA